MTSFGFGHAVAAPRELSTTVPGMLQWVSLALLKPAVAYAALTVFAVPLVLALPDPVTFLSAMTVVGTGIGLLYGSFYISKRGKIAPFERDLREKEAEFERAQEKKKAEADREIQLRRTETEAECMRLMDGARKESNQALIEQQAERLGHQDERIRANEVAIVDLEKKLEVSETRYDNLDAEFLEFARLVIVRHGHSPDETNPDEK